MPVMRRPGSQGGFPPQAGAFTVPVRPVAATSEGDPSGDHTRYRERAEAVQACLVAQQVGSAVSDDQADKANYAEAGASWTRSRNLAYSARTRVIRSSVAAPGRWQQAKPLVR